MFTQTMTNSNLFVEQYLESVNGGMHAILEKLAQGGDVKADANIAKIVELSDAMADHIFDSTNGTLSDFTNADRAILRQITVNQSKQDRVEKSERAIGDREEKKVELLRKLKGLRKHLPEQIRDHLCGTFSE